MGLQSMQATVHGVAESDTTEWLSTAQCLVCDLAHKLQQILILNTGSFMLEIVK